MKLPVLLPVEADYREALSAVGLTPRSVDLVVLTWPEPAGLMAASEAQLRSRGVTPAQVRRLQGAFGLAHLAHEQPPTLEISEAADVATLLAPSIGSAEQEIFVTLSLNVRNRLLDVNMVGVGDVASVHVSPRMAFRDAVRGVASAIILAHNHPSGDPEPSYADIRLTQRMVEVGAILGIPVLDHVVIGRPNRFASLKSLGLMGPEPQYGHRR